LKGIQRHIKPEVLNRLLWEKRQRKLRR
jgi:hypothetical protein